MQSNLIRDKISCLFFASQRGENFDIGYVFLHNNPPAAQLCGGRMLSFLFVGLMGLCALLASARQDNQSLIPFWISSRKGVL